MSEREYVGMAMTCNHMESHPSHNWRLGTDGELIFCKGRGDRQGLAPTSEESNARDDDQ